MRRRAFITLLGSAVVWPVAARTQQSEGVRRIGILMNRAADDPQGQARLAAFQQGMQQLGWTDGGNMRIDVRWGADDVDRERRYAAELVALAPDIVLASGTLSVTALQHVSRTLPIVFVGVTDPVGAGFVDSLARPGGNVTGFMIYEYDLSGKWLELLKQIAPSVMRVAIIRNPENPVGVAVFSALRAAAQPLRVEVSPIDSRGNADEIERAITAFARSPNSGLILTPNAAAMPAHYSLIVGLAARYKLPAVYPFPEMVTNGGLISFGPDVIDQSRRAAEYVDRILKGEKPAGLPVQTPTKYQLIINLKTAKALGVTVPPSVLARADEVIE
ncbi:MAG: ABC transporter substrate-binding protein [Pseudolabrys sp.]|jgi:putative ABC transport system substrate-binding protein